jgi:hypothetical protein
MLDVMKELGPIGKKFTDGDFRGGLHLLHSLWAQLPEPKAATPNAYMIVEYGVAFALKSHDMKEAWGWAELAPDFREKRHDGGEVEFLLGRVAFEDGKLELAAEHFREAKRKSRGRMFVGEDPKYLALLKTKQSSPGAPGQ